MPSPQMSLRDQIKSLELAAEVAAEAIAAFTEQMITLAEALAIEQARLQAEGSCLSSDLYDLEFYGRDPMYPMNDIEAECRWFKDTARAAVTDIDLHAFAGE